MASDFHPLANRRRQRCHVGQYRGLDGAGSDISLSDLEAASNGCCGGLRGGPPGLKLFLLMMRVFSCLPGQGVWGLRLHRRYQYIASYFVTTHSPSLFSSVTENSSL